MSWRSCMHTTDRLHCNVRWRHFLCAALCCALIGTAVHARELRVCADPNNLPFSNEQREGFENRLIELLARDLHADVRYIWIAQRRGFIRNGLRAGQCDLIAGVAAGMEMLATTQPYYRSSYVFVTREDRKLDIRDLDDRRLTTLKVGVQIIGDDFANTPPAHALARRGIVDNVRGFSVYGNYAEHDPPRAIVDAVARNEIDVAIAWGPMAGYFARLQPVAMRVAPVTPSRDGPFPMTFGIAMGMRRGEPQFKDEIQRVLDGRQAEIAALLRGYGVPTVPATVTSKVDTD
jgi:mxaJ protein